MNKTNSISLIFIGCALLPIGILLDNLYLKYPILFSSIILNVIAVVKSFKEKNRK
jgi:hypothetical protein